MDDQTASNEQKKIRAKRMSNELYRLDSQSFSMSTDDGVRERNRAMKESKKTLAKWEIAVANGSDS